MQSGARPPFASFLVFPGHGINYKNALGSGRYSSHRCQSLQITVIFFTPYLLLFGGQFGECLPNRHVILTVEHGDLHKQGNHWFYSSNVFFHHICALHNYFTTRPLVFSYIFCIICSKNFWSTGLHSFKLHIDSLATYHSQQNVCELETLLVHKPSAFIMNDWPEPWELSVRGGRIYNACIL